MTGIPGDNVGSYISRDGMWAIGTGDAFTIVAPVTTLQDASANLTFKYQVAEMTAPAATFAWTTNFIILDPGGSNRSIDYPCRVSSDRGRIVQVMCKVGQANTFTLRDEADLAGSKLKLRAATRVLDAGDQITLVCDGTYWWEAAFSG